MQHRLGRSCQARSTNNISQDDERVMIFRSKPLFGWSRHRKLTLLSPGLLEYLDSLGYLGCRVGIANGVEKK